MILPEGECATAQAVSEAGTIMSLSTDSSRSMEEVAPGPLWFQLYYYTRKEAQGLVERAQAAGYCAIVLTVDAPMLGKRERDIRNDFGSYQRTNYPLVFSGNAPHLSAKRLEPGEPYEGKTLTWETLTWLRSTTPLPILLKGILTAEGALLGLEYGAAPTF